MINRHITRFGFPLTKSGALYCPSDEEGLIQMDVDLNRTKLQAKGLYITPEIESKIKKDVKHRAVEYHNKVNQLGVPEKFKKLFQITRKAQTEQYVRQMAISEYELFLLIHNCSQIRFTHRSKFKQYVPSHLKLSDNDRDDMKAGNPKKLTTKVHSGLLERKYVHVHLFEYGSEWHCFYFSHHDIEPTNKNHWKYGSHLHYISHLSSELKKRWIWSKFNRRSADIPDSLHIKFEPFIFPDPSKGGSYLNNEGKLPLWMDIFNPDFAQGCGSEPLPVAHVATRGLMFVHVSLRPH